MKASKVIWTLTIKRTIKMPRMVTAELIRLSKGLITPVVTVRVFVIIPFITSLLFRDT